MVSTFGQLLVRESNPIVRLAKPVDAGYSHTPFGYESRHLLVMDLDSHLQIFRAWYLKYGKI
jgi:hypothetical protein